ncbi:TRAP transporter substrate-binding protein [Bacillus sp. Marseille-P3661]|uniref:TRAP transporter substrate-binding protein n=1 Tax=Bacillus sp. Marseille-P3661 TaxID=1936234 RepID=UPI000C857523|nr:DctP family TRAP transporter solute-binding subunit [Bacillus sp. Marseille-P3661]
MFFKRKSLLLLSLLFALGLVLAACGGSETANEEAPEGNSGDEGSTEEKSYHWRFVTEELDGQVQYEYAEEFAKRMEEKSNGNIKIDVYEFGGLGSEVNQVEQLQNGAVEFAIVSPGFTGTMVPEGQLFALHFLFPDDVAKTQEILNSSEALNVDLAAKYEEHNIKPLAYWTEGATQWTGNKELNSPDDFKGFKMRTQTSPLMLESYKAYGANPTPMSWGELYTGLEQGTVEGQENPIFFIEDASFHEVQSHMTISNHNNYVAMTTVNPTFYNDLPADIRALIDETVEELQPWIFDLQKQQNTEFLEKIKTNTEYPTEVIELTEEQRQAFKELALPVHEYYVNEVSTVSGAILEKLKSEIEAAAAN